MESIQTPEAPELYELENIKYITVVDEINIQIVAMGSKDGKFYQYMVGIVPTASKDSLIQALEQIEVKNAVFAGDMVKIDEDGEVIDSETGEKLHGIKADEITIEFPIV